MRIYRASIFRFEFFNWAFCLAVNRQGLKKLMKNDGKLKTKTSKNPADMSEIFKEKLF